MDPTAESLKLAKLLKEEFKPLNKKFWLVLNKATPNLVKRIEGKVKDLNLQIDGVIRFDESVFESCLEGKPLTAKEAFQDVKNLVKEIGILS